MISLFMLHLLLAVLSYRIYDLLKRHEPDSTFGIYANLFFACFWGAFAAIDLANMLA